LGKKAFIMLTGKKKGGPLQDGRGGETQVGKKRRKTMSCQEVLKRRLKKRMPGCSKCKRKKRRKGPRRTEDDKKLTFRWYRRRRYLDR